MKSTKVGFIYELLKTAGDVHDLDVNGSVTPQKFYYTPEDGKTALISRVNFHILDALIDPAKFGGLAALTNGLLIQLLDVDGNVTEHFTTDLAPIKTNAQFNLLAGIDSVIVSSATIDALAVRWTIANAGAVLVLNPGEKFQVIVRDDLTAIDEFHVCIQGVYQSATK